MAGGTWMVAVRCQNRGCERKNPAESMGCDRLGMACSLLFHPPVSVTSITARLPRVKDRLLLHKQMIESLPFALLVCDARTLKIVEHNAAASAFFGEVEASSRPSRSLVG